ncbi:MAG: hypothetical protein Tsb0021_12270 [Chlamydiales bacterium]
MNLIGFIAKNVEVINELNRKITSNDRDYNSEKLIHTFDHYQSQIYRSLPMIDRIYDWVLGVKSHITIHQIDNLSLKQPVNEVQFESLCEDVMLALRQNERDKAERGLVTLRMLGGFFSQEVDINWQLPSFFSDEECYRYQQQALQNFQRRLDKYSLKSYWKIYLEYRKLYREDSEDDGLALSKWVSSYFLALERSLTLEELLEYSLNMLMDIERDHEMTEAIIDTVYLSCIRKSVKEKLSIDYLERCTMLLLSQTNCVESFTTKIYENFCDSILHWNHVCHDFKNTRIFTEVFSRYPDLAVFLMQRQYIFTHHFIPHTPSILNESHQQIIVIINLINSKADCENLLKYTNAVLDYLSNLKIIADEFSEKENGDRYYKLCVTSMNQIYDYLFEKNGSGDLITKFALALLAKLSDQQDLLICDPISEDYKNYLSLLLDVLEEENPEKLFSEEMIGIEYILLLIHQGYIPDDLFKRIDQYLAHYIAAEYDMFEIQSKIFELYKEMKKKKISKF